ncbi:MAG: hypothetical protein JWM19_860 [Actinomycetia bacterium]|nr:hypothetical protein [Actinomycetes bacterium]
MPPTPANQKAGELHEIYLAEVNDGSKTRASGSKWFDQGDGRNNHDLPFAFCWDGKSTRGKQIAVTLEMIAKIREQAQGERPELGLRWYANENLDKVLEDWIAVPGDDWGEVLPAARKLAALEAEFGDLDAFLHRPAIVLPIGSDLSQDEMDRFRSDLDDAVRRGGVAGLAQMLRAPQEQGGDVPDEMTFLREELSVARQALEDANSAVRSRDDEAAVLRVALANQARNRVMVPQYVPRLPWTIIDVHKIMGRTVRLGHHYDEQGVLTVIDVGTVVVERTHDPANRPQLMVNDRRVRDGSLYVDGALVARACADDRSLEAG